jgi:hypothetical protein
MHQRLDQRSTGDGPIKAYEFSALRLSSLKTLLDNTLS